MTHIHENIVAVIPALNEEDSIGDVILSTQKYVNHIIVFNDGSSDRTAEIVSKLGVNLINNPCKQGKGNALRSLFKEAVKYDPDIIISLDADGQHDPYEIPKLIKPIIFNGMDMVIGSRFLKDSITDISLLRSIGLRIINFLHFFLFSSQIEDTQSGFRSFSKRAFNIVLQSKENGYGIESEQLIIALNGGYKLSEVPVNIRYNGLRKTSKMNFIKHGFLIVLLLLKLFVEKK